MSSLAGPVMIACAVLALGGGAKVTTPEPTARALRTLGLPGPALAVRALGGVEVLLAVVAVTVGGRLLPGLVACAYLCFAAFVAVAVRRGPDIASCGCFGRVDTPPHVVHVVVNLAASGACGAAAVFGVPGLGAVLDAQPALGLPYLGFALMGTYAAYLALTLLPRVLSPPRITVPLFAVATEHHR